MINASRFGGEIRRCRVRAECHPKQHPAPRTLATSMPPNYSHIYTCMMCMYVCVCLCLRLEVASAFEIRFSLLQRSPRLPVHLSSWSSFNACINFLRSFAQILLTYIYIYRVYIYIYKDKTITIKIKHI